MSYKNSAYDNIKEVYNENMVDELRKISDLANEYNYLSMDTEFPGIVYPNTHQISSNVFCNFSNSSVFNGINGIPGKMPSTSIFLKKSNETSLNQTPTNCYDFNYKNIKMNVDDLKMIQFGLTLSDKYGNHPEGISTWQFNFNFDLETDIYLHESIQLLEFAGIDFNKFFHDGIEHEYFAENIIASGIVLNDNIKWITFHGAYDFAYLLKTISNQPIPEDEQTFLEYLFIYFPNFYDLRHMIKNISWLKGSLSRIATDLDIKWSGSIHQAGCDSILTSRVFTKLSLNYTEFLNLEKDLNMLYGFNSYMISQEGETENTLKSAVTNSNPIPNQDYNSSINNSQYNTNSHNEISTNQNQLLTSNPSTTFYNNYNKYQINSQIRPNNGIVYNPYVNSNYSSLNNTNSNVFYQNISSSRTQLPPFNNYLNYDYNNYYGGNIGSFTQNAIRK